MLYLNYLKVSKEQNFGKKTDNTIDIRFCQFLIASTTKGRTIKLKSNVGILITPVHIVGNPRAILIDSLVHHPWPWVHLVTFACFQSNRHDLCYLFLPNEITWYVCVLLFYFGGALFKPTWRINMCCCEMSWRSVLFLQLLYSRWLT